MKFTNRRSMDNEVARGLAQAFGKEVPAPTEEVVETPEAELPEEEQPEEEPAPEIPEEEAPQEEPAEEPAPEIPEVETPTIEAPAFDINGFVKEQFGFADPDSLKNELDQLRKPKETQFANDESKRIYEALVAGKEDEIADYLYTRKLLKDTSSMSVEDKLKLKMKLEYPDFDQDDIDTQFESMYGFNEDDIDETLLKSEKKKHAANLKKAAADADSFFEQYQQKIELPSIQPTPTQTDSGPTQAQLDQAAQWVENLNNSLAKLTPQQAAFKTRFNDEANKMSFDVEFVPDVKGFDVAKEKAKDVSRWLDENFLDAKGNLRTDELSRMIYLYNNRDKVFNEYLTKAKNHILRWQLANGKQVTPGSSTQRNYTTQPVSETEKVRKLVFGD